MKNFKKAFTQTILLITIALLFIISLQAISAADHSINDTTNGGIRNAVVNNASVVAGDTVYLQPGTYNGNNNTNMTINKNLTFKGNGSTDSVVIDAQGLSRIFTIASNVNLTFINITFINGYVNGSNGGAIYNIYGASTLTIINCSFINNNVVNSSSANGFGGAIYNGGANLTVTSSTFEDNNVKTNGGAIYSLGRDANVTNSTFTKNSASNGAAIYSYGANCTVINSTFTDNSVSSTGGAIWAGNNYNITVANSTFINNSAGSSSGAIHIPTSGSSNSTVSGSIFTNNTAGNNGGAIGVSTANVNIINSIFTNNEALNNGGAIYNFGNMSIVGNTMSGNSAGLGQMIYNNGTMGILNLTYLSNSTVKTSKGSNVTVYATLTDDIGNTVTGQDISFCVDGVFIANVTSIEGKANTTYLVTKGPVSVLPVTGDYAGHDGYSIVLKNGELLIPKIPTKITISVPQEVKVGDTVTLTSRLTDEDGNILVGKTVDFYVDGVKVGSGVTDENGIAKLNYTFNKAGKPKVEAKFAGDSTYFASNATNQTVVSKIPTIITVETDNEIITVTLTDDEGTPLPDKEITITVNGQTFIGTTDINGQVVIKYPNANKYKVTAKFAGDDKYLPSSATVPGESEPVEPTSTISAAGKVTMKETGIPIVAVLLTLITSIGLLVIRKDE